VAVDNVPRGVTPLKLASIGAGQHQITLSHNGTTIQRRVTVTPGATASVVASINASSPTVGWVAFKAPFEMRVFEDGALLGTTATERVMLPAGQHTFDVVNDELEFSGRVSVRIPGGNTATAAVTVPNGRMSINARPWAEVFIDGQSIGTTPLANVPVALGRHEVVWRHPQLGERRQTVIVKAKSLLRAAIDFQE
jgi:hypothetical protein